MRGTKILFRLWRECRGLLYSTNVCTVQCSVGACIGSREVVVVFCFVEVVIIMTTTMTTAALAFRHDDGMVDDGDEGCGRVHEYSRYDRTG